MLHDAPGPVMTLDSIGQSVTFPNPSGSLTLSGGSGEDTITILSTDQDGPFNAASPSTARRK